MRSPWREPREESADLFPGLVVHDGVQSGSITLGPTRLPLWSFMAEVVREGWEQGTAGWEMEKYAKYGFGQREASTFIGALMEHRGEFARLILVLADVQRREWKCRERHGDRDDRAWWERKKDRRRVSEQLRRCLVALDAEGATS